MLHNLFLAAALALQTPAAPTAGLAPADTPPAPEEILAIPAELQERLRREVLATTRGRKQRLDRLVDFIFSDTGLGIRYDGDSTTTVEQTFRQRRTNCLGLTLLAVTLAREAGLTAYGQEIDRVLSRELDENVVVQSIHANAGIDADGRQYVIDVAADSLLAATLPKPIRDDRLLALYYNNRAMELLTRNRLDEAENWLLTALRYAPDHPLLLNNAGVLMQRRGRPAEAEARLMEALRLNSRHPATLANLIAFHTRNGNLMQATQWQRRAERRLRSDPFHQFQLGLRYEREGDMARAAQLYRRAIRLDDQQHIFHFGLARALLRQGQYRAAGDELQRAYELGTPASRTSYQAKLEALQRLQLHR